MNPFVLPAEQYRRKIDFINAYKEDMSTYLQLMTDKPLDICRAYVDKETGPGGKFEMKDPDALVLTKVKPGHRVDQVIKLSEYFDDVRQTGKLMSPTMAVYLNPKEKKSLLATYISGNIQRRSSAKKAMFTAAAADDHALETFYDIQQTSFKLKNNSLSGAHCSPSTILFLKSAHSTLTSTCRCASGYGNANNEKFIMGNRHYWCPDIVKANIVSIINNSDYDLITQAMQQYGLRAPTADEVMSCITYSTDLYWRNPTEISSIERLVAGMSDLERTAFVYTGDLYHTAINNPGVMRDFIDRLSGRATEPVDNPDEWVSKMDADLKAFVSMLCYNILDGKEIKDVKASNPEGYAIIAATAKKVIGVLDDYSLLIRAFMTTPNVPASVAALPDSIRRSAITSDTDSTIFTVQWWVEWFSGKIDYSEKSCAVRDSIVYLASQSIIHLLALMTANMGVIPEQRFQLAMKNEYCFPVFSLTSRSKHYYAYVGAREGLVFKNMELEIKGVALRNSNCPPHVMAELRKLIKFIMDNVMSGAGISIYEVMGKIAAIENDIRFSIESGKYDYLTTTTIKTIESYRNPEKSNYNHYLMWEEVFAPKYGHTEKPTYSAIKVSLDADNPTKLKAWLDRMPDQDVADRMRAWLTKNGRTDLTTLLLPETICGAVGIPKEIICGIDIRKLIFSTTNSFYLVLESLGFFMQNNNYTRLVSDYDFLTLDNGMIVPVDKNQADSIPVIDMTGPNDEEEDDEGEVVIDE